ncbi:MAG: carboxypeptidase regulatory-like domain-containing protein, partial [Phycisphaerae bacterium]|nr:carboxypeptidase regulatory-like domain-containing protein [Phycisphaerae bacterium]
MKARMSITQHVLFSLTILAFLCLAGCGGPPSSGGGSDNPLIGGLVDLLDGSDPAGPPVAADPNESADPNDDAAPGDNEGDQDIDDPAALPQVRFTVEPLVGARPLTVVCEASTLASTAVPGGVLTWLFDDVAETGPMSEFSRRTHVFRKGGTHTVALMLSVAGLTAPIQCVSEQTGTKEAVVVVLPRISGKVFTHGGMGIAGVAVTANPGGITAVTKANGAYELDVPYNWSGLVAPHHSQYAFDRSSRSYSRVTTDVPQQDFVASEASKVTISGTVLTDDGSPIPQVRVSADNGGGSAVTDTSGCYHLEIPRDWSGTVAPESGGYTFDPNARSYSSVQADA